MLIALVPAMLVMLQPDLGTSLVYVVIALAVLFVAGTTWRHFAALGAIGAVGIALTLVAAPAVGVQVLKPYQVDRLTAFLNPSDDPANQGYQQNQSRIAIGAGQKTGRGDHATQTRLNFLPEHHTDFIFAVIGEELRIPGRIDRAVAVRAADLARPADIDHGEEPLRRTDSRGHRGDAHVPGLRQRRHDDRNHADHRRAVAADSATAARRSS